MDKLRFNNEDIYKLLEYSYTLDYELIEVNLDTDGNSLYNQVIIFQSKFTDKFYKVYYTQTCGTYTNIIDYSPPVEVKPEYIKVRIWKEI